MVVEISQRAQKDNYICSTIFVKNITRYVATYIKKNANFKAATANYSIGLDVHRRGCKVVTNIASRVELRLASGFVLLFFFF
jgi:hypothetical protein